MDKRLHKPRLREVQRFRGCLERGEMRVFCLVAIFPNDSQAFGRFDFRRTVLDLASDRSRMVLKKPEMSIVHWIVREKFGTCCDRAI